jgi:hypothetical protein
MPMRLGYEQLRDMPKIRSRSSKTTTRPGISGLGMAVLARQSPMRLPPAQAGACAIFRSTDGGGMTAKPNDVGVLLTNLGTPDAPEPSAVRRYLAEFLSRSSRGRDCAGNLEACASRRCAPHPPGTVCQGLSPDLDRGGLALMAISKRQAEALRIRFGDDLCIGLAMRYGDASIGFALSTMVEHGFNRILVAPLYPQYCAATTASAVDAVTWNCKGCVPSRRSHASALFRIRFTSMP